MVERFEMDRQSGHGPGEPHELRPVRRLVRFKPGVPCRWVHLGAVERSILDNRAAPRYDRPRRRFVSVPHALRRCRKHRPRSSAGIGRDHAVVRRTDRRGGREFGCRRQPHVWTIAAATSNASVSRSAVGPSSSARVRGLCLSPNPTETRTGPVARASGSAVARRSQSAGRAAAGDS